MKYFASTLFILTLASAISTVSFAQSSSVEKKARRSKSAQVGVVKSNGTAIYEGRSFDAPVVTYFDARKKIVMSKKKYKGIGGFGLFYKVRVKKGVYGYIADTDIIPQFEKRRGVKKLKENPVFDEAQKTESEKNRVPVSEMRWIGGALGSVSLAEKFSGKTLSAGTSVFGFQMSGPNSLVDFVPTDLEVLVSLAAPSYYKDLSDNNSASGMFLMSNLGLLFPMVEKKDFYIYYGVGLSVIYTRFKLIVNSTNFDSQELRLGGYANLGGIYRISKDFVIRPSIKYHFEVANYLAYQLAFQVNY